MVFERFDECADGANPPDLYTHIHTNKQTFAYLTNLYVRHRFIRRYAHTTIVSHLLTQPSCPTCSHHHHRVPPAQNNHRVPPAHTTIVSLLLTQPSCPTCSHHHHRVPPAHTIIVSHLLTQPSCPPAHTTIIVSHLLTPPSCPTCSHHHRVPPAHTIIVSHRLLADYNLVSIYIYIQTAMLGTREYTLCSPFRANAHNSSYMK